MFARSLARSVGLKTPIAHPVMRPLARTLASRAQQPRPLKNGVLSFSFKAVLVGAVGFWGYLTYLVYKESNPGPQLPQTELKENGLKKKSIVILGSGWGAISVLNTLDTTKYNVTIVSPRNYFLFTPLLPSVPSGTISIKSICDSVRTIVRQNTGEVNYLEASATDIDPVNKIVTIEHKNPRFFVGEAFTTETAPIQAQLSYDYLVYAVGATVNTFGIPGIYEHASFMKEANDATAVRQKLFNQIEASRLLPIDSEERKRLQHFVVCGGGPTGVELAAEVRDYIEQDLTKIIPGIENEMKVTLIEAQNNVLASFHPRLIEYTKEIFREQQLELRCNTMVKKVDEKNVYATYRFPNGTTEDVVIPYGTLVWAGGNTQRELTKKLSAKIVEQSSARRGLLIDDYLKLDGSDSIFALGDCTFTPNPPTAQVAYQQGLYLGEHFNKLSKVEDLEHELTTSSSATDLTKVQKRLSRAQKVIKPFEYIHQGSLAYIGKERAIADLTWGSWSTVALGGNLTFFFWRSAYVTMMMGIKNKIFICSDWIKVSIFGRDTSQE